MYVCVCVCACARAHVREHFRVNAFRRMHTNEPDNSYPTLTTASHLHIQRENLLYYTSEKQVCHLQTNKARVCMVNHHTYLPVKAARVHAGSHSNSFALTGAGALLHSNPAQTFFPPRSSGKPDTPSIILAGNNCCPSTRGCVILLAVSTIMCVHVCA